MRSDSPSAHPATECSSGTGAVTVGVPHRLENGLTAIDDGQAYDSTVQ
jgi:hypothetical protein